MSSDEENEHIISSDEYSDDDDDDALMNDAVRAQNQDIRSNYYGSRDKQPNWRIDQKQKELSSLIRRNKISIIYKKKSVKWLNSKRQRDRYKNYITQNIRNLKLNKVENSTEVSLRKRQRPSIDENDDAVNIQGIAKISKNDASFNSRPNKEDIKEVNNRHQNSLSTFINHTNEVINQPENIRLSVSEKSIQEDENVEDNQRNKKADEKAENPRKRSKSPSSNQNKEAPQSDLDLNNMFSKFDKIATNHVDHVSNSYLKSFDEKMENLSSEIDILNEVINAKEKELNRLSYLKMVKEEIYFRLNRKRHTLQKKESLSDKQHQYTLHELKELENCLSDKKKSSEGYSSDTIQNIIENRACMSAEDLAREKNNTSRLHSLLVSQNMLHATELLDNSSFVRNVKNMNIGLANKICDKNDGLDNENLMNTKGRQGDIRNVKSLIADFREKNPELLPHISKNIKSTELNPQQIFSIPLFENISRSQLLNKNKAKFLSHSGNEISITPIGASKKMTSSLESVRLDDNFIKTKNTGNINGKSARNIQYPLCQECKTKESRFVCAGCGNQWYCSKSCQISAWDAHSDLCTK